MEINIYGDVHINSKEVKSDVKKIRASNNVNNVKRKVKGRDICCQCCNDETTQIEVHHILPVSKYPDLAADDGNMICLCQKCHKRYHNEYDLVNSVTFSLFMKRFGKRGF